MSNNMRYDCVESGCFNRKHRPKFSVFADCFPGKISMTDIDGAVEVNNRFLFAEFKSDDCKGLPVGQEIFYKRLAQDIRNTIVIAAGDCETMQFNKCMTIENGRFQGWEHTNIEMLRDRMKRWADHALAAQVLT